MQKLAKDLYVESGFVGVTVGALLTSDGIICIDTPTHPVDARRWRQKLAQLSSRPVLFIINLDHHRDRVLGNQWFEAPVIAHESTYERVRLHHALYGRIVTRASRVALRYAPTRAPRPRSRPSPRRGTESASRL